jgi:N-acetylmuramoyl-L-alanine amidase
MRRFLGLICGFLACLAVLAASQPAAPDSPSADPIGDLMGKIKTGGQPQGVPMVIGARIGEQADRTRFVVELSDPVAIRVFTLANPNRVVIDMPSVVWHLQDAPHPSGRGPVRSYRYGLFRPGNSRFVIDLNGPVQVGAPMALPPEGGRGYRIVIDLFATTQAKFEESAGWPADLRAREMAAQKLAALPPPPLKPVPGQPKSKIIVVDAGHGGIDSGTHATSGLLEKDVVLDEALRLRDALQKHGYLVHLTRDTDSYIPLRERVNIARGYHADLFISLHADSNPDTSVTGASVYTLSESGSDKEAAALARKENQSDIIAGVDLKGQDDSVSHILIDLAQRDTMNRSSRFAQTAVVNLSHATDILPRQPHRAAAFVVLKAPDVPAVLIELGYLSNPSDARQMATTAWRNGVADAIASAVDGHFASATDLAEVPR